jgi:predicted Fe-Mo cluster-binding NifX family protein
MNRYSILNTMRLAIASKGKTEDSEISEVAGRAQYYLIFEDKKLVKTMNNPFRVGGGGAGNSVTRMLANEKVDKIIAGHFGSKMIDAMKESGVKSKVATGKVKEVL